MARGISLVSVRWQDLKTTIEEIAPDFKGFVVISKVWLDSFTVPETDLVMISKNDLANPLVCVNKAGVPVKEIEQQERPQVAPAAACKIADLPDFES
jgi:hypothetical protein